MLKGIITGQKLTLKDIPLIVSDSIDYLEAVFAFRSKDWEECEKWAHFSQGDVVYDIKLTDNKIRKTDHLNLGAGSWKIYLHGTSNTGMRITTDPVSFGVKKSGVLNGQPLPEIPLSVAENLDLRLSFLEEVGGYPSGVSPYIISEAKGENILVTDSAKAKLRGLVLYGKSTQDGTPSPENPVDIVSAGQDGEIGVMFGGKNLFPVNADKTASYGGLARKYIADGGYEFTGTATASHWATQIQLTATVPADGIYTLSVDANVFPEQGAMYQHHRGDTQLKVVTDGKKLSYTATMQKGDTLLVLVGATNGEVVNSTVYVQLELGSTATVFEKPKDTQTLTVQTPNGLGEGDYIDFAKGVRVEGGIETPLTEEELAQFATLKTNYPTTTILNDEGVGMKVSYVADAKNYIDKKFTELAAAIVANA